MCHINPWLRMVRVKLLKRVMCLQGNLVPLSCLSTTGRARREKGKIDQTNPLHSVTDHITIHSLHLYIYLFPFFTSTYPLIHALATIVHTLCITRDNRSKSTVTQ
jgi:hypothetical protein